LNSAAPSSKAFNKVVLIYFAHPLVAHFGQISGKDIGRSASIGTMRDQDGGSGEARVVIGKHFSEQRIVERTPRTGKFVIIHKERLGGHLYLNIISNKKGCLALRQP
jgi:hypothetical protein